MTYKVGSTELSITCDVCGAKLSMKRTNTDDHDAMRVLWKKAKDEGWTSTVSRHFCKRCGS